MKKWEIRKTIYSLVLFLFTFKMINREFLLFNKIDLVFIILPLIAIACLVDLRTLRLKLLNLGVFEKKVFFFYMVVALSSVVAIVFRKPFLNISIFLRLNFLYAFGLTVFMYLVLFKEYFYKKILVSSIFVSVLDKFKFLKNSSDFFTDLFDNCQIFIH